MKIKKRLFVPVLGAVCLVTGILGFPAHAAETNNIKPLSNYEQLKKDIMIIENLELDEIQEFQKNNKAWLDDVTIRLENYLETIPDEQQDSELIELRGDNPDSRTASDYFSSYYYHLRNGYYTYSMIPKMTTRLLRPYAEAGWNELAKIYNITSDVDSLYMQYMCHFDLFVESDWDIERGVPEVGSYAEMLARLCNPQYNDGYPD